MMVRLIIFAIVFSSLAQAQEVPPARVATAQVEERVLSPTTRMVGVLRFVRVAEVAGEIEGLITAHSFDTGWTLDKGAVLARLNTDFIHKDMDINRSQAAEISADIEKLALEVKRLESLKRDNMASRKAYEEAFYSHKALLERRETLKRQLERMQLSVEKSKVRAPFDGIVLEKKKELGDWVDKGEALARLGSTDGVQVVVPVSEALLPFQKEGSEFEVFIPALGRSLRGTLSGLVPFAEVRSKSVYLKIELPYESGMLENLSAEVQVPSAIARRLRLVPRAALLQTQGNDTIYTIVEGKAAPLSVNIVARAGQFIAVDDEHIQPGMVVVVDGNDRLMPGQPVQVIEQ